MGFGYFGWFLGFGCLLVEIWVFLGWFLSASWFWVSFSGFWVLLGLVMSVWFSLVLGAAFVLWFRVACLGFRLSCWVFGFGCGVCGI